MRVMVCYYFFDRAIPLGEDIAQGFESLGHAVCRFDSSIPVRWGKGWKLAKSLAKWVGRKAAVALWHEQRLSAELSARFVAAAENFKPELIVVIQGERIDARTVQSVCRASGTKSVLWWVKPPRWQASIHEDRPHYDAVFTIDGSSAVEGIGHLPSWALNRKVYYPGPFEEKTRELLFVGSWSPLRQAYLETVADLPLKIIGSGWRKRLPLNHPLHTRLDVEWVGGSDLADAYRRALAVIDIPQFEQTGGQGVNMRFADVPACGTVLITKDVAELREWFVPGEDVLVYADTASLQSACQQSLEVMALTRRLGHEGHKTSSRMPLFSDRARTLLEIM